MACEGVSKAGHESAALAAAIEKMQQEGRVSWAWHRPMDS